MIGSVVAIYDTYLGDLFVRFTFPPLISPTAVDTGNPRAVCGRHFHHYHGRCRKLSGIRDILCWTYHPSDTERKRCSSSGSKTIAGPLDVQQARCLSGPTTL